VERRECRRELEECKERRSEGVEECGRKLEEWRKWRKWRGAQAARGVEGAEES